MIPSLKKSWVVWACAALFYFYQFILRVSPTVMAAELMRDFKVDACALGTLTSFYYYAYAGLQLPVGMLLDKFGPRRLLTCSALICTGGCLFFASAETVMMGSLGRFFIGVGSGFAFLSCMKLGTLWFPPQRLSMVIGLTLLFGTAGAMSGSYPMSFLIDEFGWRHAMWVAGGGGIILAFLCATIVRDRAPQKLKAYIEQHHPFGNPRLSLREGLKIILKKGQTWLLAFYGIMMYIPLSGFGDMWGVPFLTQVHHMDKQSASLASSFLYFGVGLGTPLYAFVSDHFKQFKFSLLGASLGALLPFMVIVYGPPLSPAVVTPMLFFVGLMLGGQFMAYSIVCEINPLSVSGMATGFQNMICLASGIVIHPLIGGLLDFFWKEGHDNGIKAYSSTTYQMAFTSIVIAIFLAVVASFFVREAYPERK